MSTPEGTTREAERARGIALVYVLGLGGGALLTLLVPWWLVLAVAVVTGAVLVGMGMGVGTAPSALPSKAPES